MDEKIVKKLRKYKHILRKVCKNNINKNKKLLIQEGGFLQFILPAATSLISLILESYFKK